MVECGVGLDQTGGIIRVGAKTFLVGTAMVHEIDQCANTVYKDSSSDHHTCWSHSHCVDFEKYYSNREFVTYHLVLVAVGIGLVQ
jgi:hypothetical protein